MFHKVLQSVVVKAVDLLSCTHDLFLKKKKSFSIDRLTEMCGTSQQEPVAGRL